MTVSDEERRAAFDAVMRAVQSQRGALVYAGFLRHERELREAIDVALLAAARVRERQAHAMAERLRGRGGGGSGGAPAGA